VGVLHVSYDDESGICALRWARRFSALSGRMLAALGSVDGEDSKQQPWVNTTLITIEAKSGEIRSKQMQGW